jgi:hypothetical protein
MNGKRRLGIIAVTLVLFSCAQTDDAAEEATTDSVALSTAPAAGDPNGTWNMRSVPDAGSDTTSTVYQIQVTNGNWSLLFPNRDPVEGRVVVDADSFIVDAGPYRSVRRQGQTVTTHAVYRINGDQITGHTTARYQNAGADSVLQLTTTGTRVR